MHHTFCIYIMCLPVPPVCLGTYLGTCSHIPALCAQLVQNSPMSLGTCSHIPALCAPLVQNFDIFMWDVLVSWDLIFIALLKDVEQCSDVTKVWKMWCRQLLVDMHVMTNVDQSILAIPVTAARYCLALPFPP